MVKNILCISLLGIVLISCKKDKTSEPTPKPSASTAIPNSPYTASSATVYHGIFYSNSFTLINQGTTEIHTNSNAYFYDSASTSNVLGNMVSVNSVMLNNAAMNFDNSFINYWASVPSNLQTEQWQVQGANGIPSFNYTSTNNTPNFASYSNLPDSISISAGFTISINGVTNNTPTGYELVIYDHSGTSLGQVFKPLQNGNNVIVFTPAELSVLTANINGSITINLENTMVLNFYGKDFKFIKSKSLSKEIQIKP